MSLSFNENRFVSVKKHESYIIINGNVPQNNSKKMAFCRAYSFMLHAQNSNMNTAILQKNNKYFIVV